MGKPDKSSLRVQHGPWKAVYDSPDVGSSSPTLLYDARNITFIDEAHSTGVSARPGIVDQFQAGYGTYGHFVVTHRLADNTTLALCGIGQKIYSAVASGGTVTLTDVTPTVTLPAAAGPWFATSFAGSLIVNDGTNKPWIWTPSGSAGDAVTYIQIDSVPNVWTAFGAPVVYGGAIFFIVNTSGTSLRNRLTLVWSEPNQPTLGYIQTGYSDFWQLAQTAQDPLTGMAGTDEALFYFRAASIGAITGYPGLQFQTTATHDVVSMSEGTQSPASIVVVNDQIIFFLDAAMRPWRYQFGGRPQPIWKQCRRYANEAFRAAIQLGGPIVENLCASYVPDLQKVAMQSPLASSLYLFDALTGGYEGIWTFDADAPITTMQPIDSVGVWPSRIDEAYTNVDPALTDTASSFVMLWRPLGSATVRPLIQRLTELDNGDVYTDSFDSTLTQVPDLTPQITTGLMGYNDDQQYSYVFVTMSALSGQAGVQDSYTLTGSTSFGVQAPLLSNVAPLASPTLPARHTWQPNYGGRFLRANLIYPSSVGQVQQLSTEDLVGLVTEGGVSLVTESSANVPQHAVHEIVAYANPSGWEWDAP